MNRLVDLGMAVAEGVRADSHDRHVDVLARVQIPDAASPGFGEVSRPLVRQEHLRALGQEHVAARYHPFGALPQRLAGAKLDTGVALQMAVVGERPRIFFDHRERVRPGEISAGRESCEQAPHDVEVRGFVDGPSASRLVRRMP
jgi:hypothetical protein